MARKHGGLGRGLDALIPMREEVEKAMKSAESDSVEILFADDEEDSESSYPTIVPEVKEKEDVSRKTEENVSRETFEEKPEIIEQSSEEDKKEEKKKEEKSSDHLKNAVIVRISEVEPNREQPRKKFDDEKLEELSESIKTYGLLQPILVQKRDGYYEIIAGERRWRAALKAGLKEIPVIVRDYTAKEILELSLVENIQRENLNPVEEAKAYRRLIDEYSLKQDEVAQRVGKSRTTITNSLRLLGLDDEVLSYLVSGELTTGHAKALLSLKNKEQQRKLAARAVKEGLSVRKLEQLTQEKPKQIAIEEPVNPAEEAVYKDLTQKLRESLGTKVSIVRSEKKNKIEIEYYSEEELERLVEILTR